ncbi:MAG: hypothetical protein M3Z11_12035 [Candidatus Dormibacteraeota bacterium]|nr:hypothetical protein [Candidatus Dormibacteraeota bacterium]
MARRGVAAARALPAADAIARPQRGQNLAVASFACPQPGQKTRAGLAGAAAGVDVATIAAGATAAAGVGAGGIARTGSEACGFVAMGTAGAGLTAGTGSGAGF